MKKLSFLSLLLLAGCGGGGGGVQLPPAPTEPQLDAFFAAVSGVVASSSEDADAKELDAMVPTTPDDNDPVLL